MRRFDFDTFDSDITQGLKDALPIEDCGPCLEKSLGRAMLDGQIDAPLALVYLDAYYEALDTPVSIGD